MTRTLADLKWPYETERLNLRPAAEDDVDAVFAYYRSPEVANYLPVLPTDRDQFGERFIAHLGDALVVELEGRVIGNLKIELQNSYSQAEVADQAVNAQAELGWVFDTDYWGKGYATETVRAQLDIAFNGLGVRRIEAGCFADNRGSWHVMEKVGMRREIYTVKESLHRSKGWVDGMGYAMLAEEFNATPAR